MVTGCPLQSCWSRKESDSSPDTDPARALEFDVRASFEKGASPSGGSGVEASCSGPDAFGYTCDDAVPFAFAEISGRGAFIGDGDDTSSGPVALGGSVPFDLEGTADTSLVMAANGYISTDPTDTGGDLSNGCPISAPPSTGPA